jgi:hypothetical protein
MAFRSRLTGLAAAAALALPAAALIATLPGAAAQASTVCSPEQVTVKFANGSTHCQGYSRVTYIALREGDRIVNICAGDLALAEVFPYGVTTRPVFPGRCELVRPTPADVVVAVIPF